ncbi:insulinase family protein [Lacisediminihabitans changchengi]|uniref:Insulinase family protein n=1 Tax=Lacisediminihabitans changchengi TaxID=2787634 RepID=A0A934SLR0_9MICO|nr:insulinase family protein [Lacisediminihabitans changchengi]MBK4349042.1 insulinase family protein [Lacisediminihabitans changchengi]
MATSISRSYLNGVQIYQADLPGVCCGTLVFGVGKRNEPATLSGITHLLEHLLLRLIEPISIEHSAVVGDNSLTVYASGSANEVGQFFSDFTRAVGRLGEITEQDLKFEKRIIRIEHPSTFDEPSAGLLTYRYGLHGVGMATFGAPSTVDMSRQEVIDWAARWLRAENASMAFSQTLPITLDLSLPRGPVARAEQPKALLATPALVASAKDGVALSLLVPRDDADLLQIALQHELFMSLRHRRGLIYDVGTWTTPVDGELSELVFVLDPEDKHIDTTVRVVSDTVREIAATGFGAAATESARIHGRAQAQRTFASLNYLDRLAEDGLHGWSTRSPEQSFEEAAEVTSERLTGVLIGSAASAIIAFNDGTFLSKRTVKSLALPVTYLTPWQPFDDGFAPPAASGAQSTWCAKGEKTRLIVTDTALFSIEVERTRRILVEDIVMAGDRSCGCLTLVDSRGRSIQFQADNWKRLPSLKRRLIEILDPALVRSFPKH